MEKTVDQMIAEAYANGYNADQIVGALVDNGYIPESQMREALAGHSSKNVLDYLARQQQGKSQDSILDQATRQVGLLTRAVAPVAAAAGTGFLAGGPFGAAVMGTGALLGPW